MKKKALLAAVAVMSVFPFASCADGRAEEIAYVPPEVERYENHIEIEGQWGASVNTGEDGAYGIGDPFVLRHNGKYYMYPSTSDPCNGIKVFESDDLVHWKDKGFAVAESEKTTHGAYAPEVIYYNGYFYLCQSRAGKGHYIYRSESPTEAFELVSSTNGIGKDDVDYGNLGMGIDGSFYVSDDGKLYLLHTSTPSGLKFNEITDTEQITTETVGKTGSLNQSNLSGWIEGPGIFRRGNFSYLTYTGNHVISKGYRVGYSYAENMKDLSSFIQPADNVTIIDTHAEHYGLGHSSNTVGPDLDSLYTAYHDLVGRGPARRFNVDRYLASGSVLTANGVTHRPVAMPKGADHSGYAEKLEFSDGVYKIGESEGYFTAEYNFVPSSGQALFFGNARISFERGVVRLSSENKTLGEAQITLPEGKLACVRVENGDGIGHVYVNGMRKITYEAQNAAGAVGYAKKEGVGFTALSNDVFGSSDFEAIKNFPTKFPAVSYLKGENRGFFIQNAKQKAGGVRVGERESTVRIGDAFAVALSKNDWVKYAIDVPFNGNYSIAAECSKASAGAQIKITVNGKSCTATVPNIEKEGTTRIYLGNIPLEQGIRSMKVEVVSGTAQIVLFDVNESATEESVSIEKYTPLNGNAVKTENGLTVAGPNGAIAFDHTNNVNFEAEISFSRAAAIDTNFGIMLRSSHYSYHNAQPAQSWRGYYLQLGSSLISLKRYDYGEASTLAVERTGNIDLESGNRHTIIIRAEGFRLTISLDQAIILNAEDSCAFFAGKLGVFAGKGEITIHSIKYQNI